MVFDMPHQPSEADPLGVGGNYIEADMLAYEQLATGSKVQNVSGRTLVVLLIITYNEVKKPGVGRPDYRVTSDEDVVVHRLNVARKMSYPGSEPGKGMSVELVATVPVGRSVYLEPVNFESFAGGTVTLFWSDKPRDFDRALVFPPGNRPPRGDDGIDVPYVNIDKQPIIISWGEQTDGTGIGLHKYADLFPAGVVCAQQQTAQGTRWVYTNSGTDVWSVSLSLFIGGYTSSMYTSGNMDGSAVLGNGYTRAGYWADLGPGQSFACEPATSGVYDSYSVAAFRPVPFSDRFNGQAN